MGRPLWEDRNMDMMDTQFHRFACKKDPQGNVVVNTENKGCIIKCTNPFIEELFESPIFSEINNIPNGISFYWIHYMLEMH